jgi:GNAT superfamily N-acetyltransferase
MSKVRIVGSEDPALPLMQALYLLMLELRPHLASADAFVARVRHQQQTQGWTLICLEDAGAPVAAASYRILENLAWGRFLYVDDLVTAPSARGKGHGETLMCWLEDKARQENCDALHLDSGLQRQAAHRLYRRQGLDVLSHHFSKKLK